MKFPTISMIIAGARRGRAALRRRIRGALPGQFQNYSHTLPNRYPWIFEFVRSQIADGPRTRLLSFGCSRGDEVLSLRNYFPLANIKGIDVDPRNIETCLLRTRAAPNSGMTFETASGTAAEESESYDAILCLAVLCRGDLTASRARRSDPGLRFEEFERVVTDFARCLKPHGLLLLHTTNFRFGDTAASRYFDVALEAGRHQLAADVLFDRNNRLLDGVRYHHVGFRKRARATFSDTTSK
jgi:SAM-dependent methyltransferase